MNGTIQRPILVLGATGAIGGGVVQAALARGHAVIAVGRDSARLQALRERHAGAALHCLFGSVAGEVEGATLTAQLRALDRPVAGVVASLGGTAERGRLLDRPAVFLRRYIDEDLLPHLVAARHLLPVLAEGGRGGSYVLVGGPGSDYPWAGYGHRSVAAAALQMLARVMHDEARAMQLRVQLLAIDTPVCTDRNRAHACPDWPSALAVGQRALAMVEQCDGGRAQAVVRYPTRERLTSSALEEAALPPTSSAAPQCPAEKTRRLRAQSLRQARALLDSLAFGHLPPQPGAGHEPDTQKGIHPHEHPHSRT